MLPRVVPQRLRMQGGSQGTVANSECRDACFSSGNGVRYHASSREILIRRPSPSSQNGRLMSTHPRYEVFDQIGQTHYGILFSGHDVVREQDVTILELHSRLRADPARWEKVWAQIQKLDGAKLENFVRIHDLARDQGWVILETMRGDLATRLAQGPIPFDQVRGILQQILESLKSLHEYGIWHGDINPSNLLYNYEGLSRLNFSPGLVLGGQILKRESGFKYVAPELLNPDFGPVGPTTDLYCLGFSVLELLKGPGFESAFRGVSAGAADPETAWMHWQSSTTEVVPPTKTLIPQLPEEFNDLATTIDRMVKKTVAERYASAAEAVADLRQGPIIRIEVKDAAPPTRKASAPRKPTPPVPATPRPQAVVPPLQREAKNQPPRPQTSPSSGADLKPWSRDWMNEKLKDPKILYSVLGAIVVLTFLILILSGRSDGDKAPIQIKIASIPGEATVSIDGRQEDKKTPIDVTVKPGTHELMVSLKGYQDSKETIEVKADGSTPKFEITLKPTPPSSSSLVPPGLVAQSKAGVDPKLKLPRKVTVKKLDDAGMPLQLALITPGEFQFGAPSQQRFPGELEQRVAKLETPFYISLTEVSYGQYAVFAKQLGGKAGTDWKKAPGIPTDERNLYPVVSITPDQAAEFCRWAAPGGRLPTEIEWERAGRGTDGRLYPWDDGAAPDSSRSNFRTNQPARIAPAISHESGATPEGLMNLLGNVAEWCNQKYSAGFDDEAEDPGIAKFYVIRGGSFKELLNERARLTMRANADPKGSDDIGFRLVVPVKRGTKK